MPALVVQTVLVAVLVAVEEGEVRVLWAVVVVVEAVVEVVVVVVVVVAAVVAVGEVEEEVAVAGRVKEDVDRSRPSLVLSCM